MKSIEARLASNPFIVGAAKGNVVSKAGIERRNKLEVEVDGESKPMGRWDKSGAAVNRNVH